MEQIMRHIFYSDLGSTFNNAAILVFRILLSLQLFRVHGLKKFSNKKENIPNPLHLPVKLNNLVAAFSDTIVPLLVILGVATRLVVLPAIAVTAIGYFVVHRNDSAQERDIPYMYTLCFLLILALGAGTFSADHYFINHLF